MTPPTAFLDACVLFPPLVRRILLGVADLDLFRPQWSQRVLDEWQIAVARRGGDEDDVIAARSVMARRFPNSRIDADPEIEATISLPDSTDNHVAAAAHSADFLVTFNLRDFPRRSMQALQTEPRHPDSFLWELWSTAPEPVVEAVDNILIEMGIDANRKRAVLKNARLPRLGKALATT